MSSGTCATRGHLDITTKAQCEAASAALKLYRKVKPFQASLSSFPPYCFYSRSSSTSHFVSSSAVLYFNGNGANTGACSSKSQCVCTTGR